MADSEARLTLRQAAARLGVSESAIRKRVERGTLRSDLGTDGRRYVYLDTVADAVADNRADASATHERDPLISELRAHNATLREQLEAERHAHAEARRIIAGLVERIPALEAPVPQHTPESPETDTSEPDRIQPRVATGGGAQEDAEPRSSTEGDQILTRRWLVPSDALPVWAYVVGVALSAVWAGSGVILVNTVFLDLISNVPGLWGLLMLLLSFFIPLLVPGAFGYWVGYNNRNRSTWRLLIPLGAVIGTVAALIGLIGYPTLVNALYDRILSITSKETTDIALISFGAPLYSFVFLAFLGHSSRQNRLASHSELRSSIEAIASRGPDAPPGEHWSERKQTIITLIGTLGAALLTALATVATGFFPGD
jgi:hypothetical protein